MATKKPTTSVTVAQPPENNVHRFREEAGCSKADLAKVAELSEKTVARVERRKQVFRRTTYYKILNALNQVRQRAGLDKVTFEELYPHLPSK